MSYVSPTVVAVLIGLTVGALSATSIIGIVQLYQTPDSTPSEKTLRTQHYEAVLASTVSLNDVRNALQSNNSDRYILVDLREQEFYEAGHITGAHSIPAYVNPLDSDIGNEERILTAFTELYTENPETPIVVYCDSLLCMTSYRIGAFLGERGVPVKRLAGGWLEWDENWHLWNEPNSQRPEGFVTIGPEPGELSFEDAAPVACRVDDLFGC